MMLNMFQAFVNEIVILFRDAKGLYKESKWYTLATAVCNLVLSIILMQFLGIAGLLIATIFSTYCIMDLGNNILLFKKAFNKKLTIYLDCLLAFITIAINVAIGCILQTFFFNNIIGYNFLWFILEAVIVCGISGIVTFILQLLFNKYFKNLLGRVKGLLIRKKI